MLRPLASYLLPILPIFLATTHAVDIKIIQATVHYPDGRQTNIPTQICPGIPPGTCCIPRPLPNAGPDKRILFTGLDVLDIAAAWVPDNGRTACDGKVQSSYTGGGRWQYDIPADQPDLIIAAGSYMRMPVGVPSEGDLGWLQGEGVLGFVTGKGDWWSKDVDKIRARGLASQFGFGSMAGKGLPWKQKVKRFRGKVVDLGKMAMVAAAAPGKRSVVERRDIISGDKGFVLCRGPSKGVYPNVIELGGVVYTAKSPQSPVYVSPDGKTLDFSASPG
ncbi:MAG: hypothetical protein LQ345_006529 [Seirophora villosa]|nr:MAG: hypothetical protein LQ345_006529 [Seirophora villosa]